MKNLFALKNQKLQLDPLSMLQRTIARMERQDLTES